VSSKQSEISAGEVNRLSKTLSEEAESGGYHLNPDKETTGELVKGLIINEKRYGYRSCPCRLASGDKNEDLDIICPCDYRDPDLTDYDTCYCGLYVSLGVVDGKVKIGSIPERRPAREKRSQMKAKKKEATLTSLSQPVWRCRVCGYLCAREGPPEVCPVCKAKKERFERFI
jgi:ferredoxin-thioredoxin reductase catalytic subunit